MRKEKKRKKMLTIPLVQVIAIGKNTILYMHRISFILGDFMSSLYKVYPMFSRYLSKTYIYVCE